MIQSPSVTPNPEEESNPVAVDKAPVTKPNFEVRLKRVQLHREFILYKFINRITRQ